MEQINRINQSENIKPEKKLTQKAYSLNSPVQKIRNIEDKINELEVINNEKKIKEYFEEIRPNSNWKIYNQREYLSLNPDGATCLPCF